MSYRALMLTVTSVNVNGLRAAAKKGFVEWLAGTCADVICLQEVRAEAKQLPEGVREPEGWHVVHVPAAAKGRAGVSLYSRRAPERTRIGFGSDEFDGPAGSAPDSGKRTCENGGGNGHHELRHHRDSRDNAAPAT